jgi:hypothetical protein
MQIPASVAKWPLLKTKIYETIILRIALYCFETRFIPPKKEKKKSPYKLIQRNSATGCGILYDLWAVAYTVS